MVPKYSHSQSMGTKTVPLRTMAWAGTVMPDRSWAVLARVSNTTPSSPSVTSSVRLVVLYMAFTPRSMPVA